MRYLDFYPRSPCGERRSTAALPSSTPYFYPRSPCGERRPPGLLHSLGGVISIHALLAESDKPSIQVQHPLKSISIHALLAESDVVDTLKLARPMLFLSTLSLRRATQRRLPRRTHRRISIHALLAESDINGPVSFFNTFGFLSTLSLRRATDGLIASANFCKISIHALLAESDFSTSERLRIPSHYFYPRSPCGERPIHTPRCVVCVIYFYPRSPCGERLTR